jgi:hypothetical protein
MKQIPDTMPKVKCSFCGKVMTREEWSTDPGFGGHQYCHGGAWPWAFTEENIKRQKEHDEKIKRGELDR